MRFLTCSTDANSCPIDAQAWVSTSEIIDPAQFGLTGVEIAKVYGWGFGAVILMFFVGYQIGCALGVIKRI